MLDSTTKRRIDTCRDILVGKVPDPKSQVEQITIALIYKFMDDMDAEAEELGGKRSFFAGEYGKYGWARLMAPNMGGYDVLALYSEAIGKMNENPGIPALFRDIFKNAYLPYRDPETLRAFLKEIDGFTYDHSERLGDAFEYLLSVLGSQGDAGQFRTPRHIIDFMVDVINPQKNESILDPACGTAGFLISAWKHILKQNTSGAGQGTRAGDQLSPTDRTNLVANIHGYDISPDMVRLSLVNLYLHGFTDPHIVEYDTLTSEERWNETADVILANPPFMSPKGGIKPHKRFSVQATRSEVLFVDYMAEHLSPQGRAAIVVPEGIIFQSGTAYKKLREMLVKTSLVAVVSLPAGVFNPYSGVKTSILILDKRLAKSCDSVLFVKVENDGYSLGAQRRKVEGGELSEAKRLLAAFFATPATFENRPAAYKVARTKISTNSGYNLSAERYRESNSSTKHEWPMTELGRIIDALESGVSVNSTSRRATDGEIGILKTSCVTAGIFQPEEHKTVVPDEFTRVRCPVRKNTIIISRMNTEALVGANAYVDRDYPDLYLPDRLWQTVISRKDVEVRYVQQVLASSTCRSRISAVCGGTSGSMKNISKPQLLAISIPLPPLAIQQEIVAEIEGYQKRIEELQQEVADNEAKIKVTINRVWGSSE
jgi:type I restriction enzyme M protein